MASSVIRGAWYKPGQSELDLLFVSGRRYVYSQVPQSVAEAFASAPSKGAYYNRKIRNHYPCREVGRSRRRFVPD